MTRIRAAWLLPLELWHGLHYALPRHPLWAFDAFKPPATPAPESIPTWRLALIYLVVTIISGVAIVSWGLAGFPPETALLVGSTLAGAVFTRIIAVNIAHIAPLFDLLTLTPPGKAGAFWVLSARYLRTDERIGQAKQIIDTLHAGAALIIIPLMVINFLVMLSPTVQRFTTNESVLVLTINMGFWLILLRLDYLYAGVLAACAGMAAPTLTHTRLEAGLVALALFLLGQVSAYAAILLAGRLLIALEWAVLLQTVWWLESVVWLMVFIGVRAALMLGVFWSLAARLDTRPRALRHLIRASL